MGEANFAPFSSPSLFWSGRKRKQMEVGTLSLLLVPRNGGCDSSFFPPFLLLLTADSFFSLRDPSLINTMLPLSLSSFSTPSLSPFLFRSMLARLIGYILSPPLLSPFIFRCGRQGWGGCVSEGNIANSDTLSCVHSKNPKLSILHFRI